MSRLMVQLYWAHVFVEEGRCSYQPLYFMFLNEEMGICAALREASRKRGDDRMTGPSVLILLPVA